LLDLYRWARKPSAPLSARMLLALLEWEAGDVQAAIAALRGPAGALFANAGTSTGGGMWAPDLEIRFQVAPRNLAVRR
jgi:hypothetical protein